MFVAVVGPSGAGKDTVLRGAAEALADHRHIVFVRRVITRTSDGVSEDHDSLSPAAFEQARDEGAYCLSWGAHGLFYGLPQSALQAVQRGDLVVANVSRGMLWEATRVFGRLAVVEITAEPSILARRIAARGRESLEEALQRVARSVDLDASGAGHHIRIDNTGPAEEAVGRFVDSLLALKEPSASATILSG